MSVSERRAELRALLCNSNPALKHSPVDIDRLLDCLIAIYDDCRGYIIPDRNGPIARFIEQCMQHDHFPTRVLTLIFIDL